MIYKVILYTLNMIDHFLSPEIILEVFGDHKFIYFAKQFFLLVDEAPCCVGTIIKYRSA
jgi:hypothetical protein